MSLFTVLIIAVTALIISIVVTVIVKVSLSSLKSKFLIIESQQQVNELLVSDMKVTIDNLQRTLEKYSSEKTDESLETEQVIKQLEYRIQSLQSEFITTQEHIKQSLEQPEDKLYSRAFKLVAKGADLEEVMIECELPRAEAEMLMSMHQAKSQ